MGDDHKGWPASRAVFEHLVSRVAGGAAGIGKRNGLVSGVGEIDPVLGLDRKSVV